MEKPVGGRVYRLAREGARMIHVVNGSILPPSSQGQNQQW